eukprot:CAMPEP_0181250184 /NCGR_PEP_ID=MMETSP1096-20121128/46178_1 /TAXON_ID=156174 ORGANISM="Chrysochromulina ericina, Strain CCMP281" /NCGR_SAMPLE_ID=MMETSP1096 /ASSEMBLY_ACC=CAM_ASM_000453 /LENGTH=37 /DNA_ID= /DNA_START= /DNA_END= /DNA_ORIENTATION=
MQLHRAACIHLHMGSSRKKQAVVMMEELEHTEGHVPY